MKEVVSTGTNRMDPRKQFSKKLALWTAVFWFVYMPWLSAILIIQPASAIYSVYMALIATVVMIMNIWAYTRNSIYEKSLLAIIDKTRLEISHDKEKETESEDTGQEEVSNG